LLDEDHLVTEIDLVAADVSGWVVQQAALVLATQLALKTLERPRHGVLLSMINQAAVFKIS